MCMGAKSTTGNLYKTMGYADCDVQPNIEVNILLDAVNQNDIKRIISDNAQKLLGKTHIAYHPIYIELWERKAFETYFDIKDGVFNPILKETRPRRGFHFTEDVMHKIAMIFEVNWEKTLRHELTHVIQAEVLGFELYNKLAHENYHNKRELDPFELQAYFNEEI